MYFFFQKNISKKVSQINNNNNVNRLVEQTKSVIKKKILKAFP